MSITNRTTDKEKENAMLLASMDIYKQIHNHFPYDIHNRRAMIFNSLLNALVLFFSEYVEEKDRLKAIDFVGSFLKDRVINNKEVKNG